jgi:phage shock protein C
MSKKLTRSRSRRILGGVCGGLGEYFDVDAIIFRFAFFALLMAGGSSIIIYLILMIVIPNEPSLSQTQAQANAGLSVVPQGEADNSTRLVIGLLLITAGVFILLNNLVPYFRLEKLWPAILVIIGLGLLFQRKNKSENNPENQNR